MHMTYVEIGLRQNNSPHIFELHLQSEHNPEYDVEDLTRSIKGEALSGWESRKARLPTVVFRPDPGPVAIASYFV